MKFKTSNRNIFINCPYDKKYENKLLALISSLTLNGLKPRSVLEIPANQNRLDRLHDIIDQCSLSIHDMSRVTLSTSRPRTPRFNMPFELGLCIAKANSKKNSHEYYVLEKEPYRLDKSLSDIKGLDPYIHKDDPIEIINCVNNIFYDSKSGKLSQTEHILALKTLLKSKAEILDGSKTFERVGFLKLTSAATGIASKIIDTL